MSSAVNQPSGDDRAATSGDRPAAAHQANSRDIVAEQKERFGGMKLGACFFGWLTATGTAVLLTGLLTGIGLGVGSSQNVTPGQASDNAQTVGLVTGIVLLVVILIAYYCGGYVAGRMARFNGLKQCLGVWLWAIIIAVVVAVLGLMAGDRFNVLNNLNGLPSIPVSGSDLTTGAIISAIAVIVIALVGAILDGLTGMRYHRRIDRATLGDTPH